jgi:Xaa-Pro aminopeptidase
MRLAAAATAAAHKAVMRATHPGVPERSLAALFEAVLASRGLTTGYGTILTQAGEVLHSHNHDQRLSAGRLLLLDGGGEMASGYTSDVTRTWPVSKHFDPRQKAAYEAVLKAEEVAIALCKPGRPYREIHDAASHVIACFLADEGLVYGDPADIVEQGAHALFFPHGVGHLIGLDVHDLENFGDLPAYPPHTARPEAFGTCYLRLNLPIESNWVVTIEPGFYVVPAILRDAKLRERFRGLVNFEKAEKWIGFGGIRIEDDIVVGDEPENLSSSIPKTAEDLARIVGTGAPADALLS